MMQNQYKPQIGNNEPQIDFRRYIKLILKKKYFIAAITIIVTGIWFIIFSLFFNEVKYESTGVVKFDDLRFNRGVGAVTDFAIMGAHSKVAVMTTKSFLGRVVDSTKYNFQFPGDQINPQKLLKKVDIGPGAKYGQYTVIGPGRAYL